MAEKERENTAAIKHAIESFLSAWIRRWGASTAMADAARDAMGSTGETRSAAAETAGDVKSKLGEIYPELRRVAAYSYVRSARCEF